MKASRKTPERRIPLVNAIIALIFSAAIIFGGASAIVSRIGAISDDIGLHIDGKWELEAQYYADEHITFVFTGYVFSTVTESVIFDAGPDIIEDIREFYRVYYGATVDAADMGDNNFLLRITADGTFFLDGDNIVLVSGEGLVRVLSFNWESEAIIIGGNRYVQR